jgi:hypothetical protein
MELCLNVLINPKFLVGVPSFPDASHIGGIIDIGPDENLRKNSLIVKIVDLGAWHQGGTDQSFIAETNGEVILRANDGDVSDNTRGWGVKLLVQSN